MNLRTLKTAQLRREALQRELGISLVHTGSFTVDERVAGSRNCENMIGIAQVPLGIAGPIRVVRAGGQTDDVYLPLATTEGALVASVNRGAKAIRESGGAVVHSHRVGATRGPVFKVNTLAENVNVSRFLESQFEELKRIAEGTSHHLTLKAVTSQGVGLYRYVRFVFDTQDAMGLNMATIATDAAARFIEAQTGARCLALSGNFCVDKKPSWQNILNNRGMEVWAEVVIPEAVLAHVLKTTAQSVRETWFAKCMLGSAVSGSMGYNAQYANVVAALFIATGQDPAHVVEGSVGITTAEVVNSRDLYLGVYLPDLMVGTIGGGTGLATQREMLTLLGVYGGNDGKNAQAFAEIVGAAVLAGEVSLLSALEGGTLATAHAALARGK